MTNTGHGSGLVQFTYEPLRPIAPDIRLFRFERGCSEQICVRIENFTLLRCPAYAALSYVWGSSKRDRTIVVNDRSLRVTENLEVFLTEALRRSNSPGRNSDSWKCTWYWIDAICINQDDDHERNCQVAMMRQIYEHADEVAIWLGQLTDMTDTASEVIKELAEIRGYDEVSLSDGSMPRISCRISNAVDSIEILYETLLFELGQIFRSPYWERVWIIQEASTPLGTRVRQVVVSFNEYSVPWNTLVKANGRLLEASYNNQQPELAPLHGIASDDIGSIDYISARRLQAGSAESLYPMLVRCRTALATDPKDKIYAIIQLCRERQLELLQPDYGLPVAEVYFRTMKALILSSKSLDCLGSAGLPRNHQIPSWVADWTVQHQRIPQPFYQVDKVWNDDGRKVLREEKLFKAAGTLAFQVRFEDQTLCLKGYAFDSVETVSKPRSTTPKASGEATEVWQSWVETARAQGTSSQVLSKVLKADIEQIWGDWSAERGSALEIAEDTSGNVFEAGDAIVDAMTSVRRLIITRKGFVGMGPAYLEINDMICIMPGSRMPLVLRSSSSKWTFVGQAYVHDIMDGEAIDELQRTSTMQTFEIE